MDMVNDEQRCGTCCHWAEATSWMRVGDFRACNLLPGSEQLSWGKGNDSETMAADFAPVVCGDHRSTYERRNTGNFPGIHAYTADASGYSSSLMCGPEFGCVHWEAKADT